MGRPNIKLTMFMLAASIVAAAAQVSEVVIHDFQSAPAGESPTGSYVTRRETFTLSTAAMAALPLPD